jgi:hypothetical protein
VRSSAFGGLPVALLALVGAIWLATRDGDAPIVVMAVTLVVVWAALVWPRADYPHVQSALGLPLIALLAVVGALGRLGTVGSGVVDTVGFVALAWSVALVAVTTGEALRCRRLPHVRDLPHCDWLPIDAAVRTVELPALDQIEAIAGPSVLLLGWRAPLWYLVSGLDNPTAYDYPLASTFGPHGQADVVRKIESGEIRWVASSGAIAGSLAPCDIERYVSEHLSPVLSTPVATLYARAQRVSASTRE